MKTELENSCTKDFSFENNEEAFRSFIKNGFFVINLFEQEFVFQMKEELEEQLKKLSGIFDITLETYHYYNFESDTHIQTQSSLTSFLQEKSFARKVILKNMSWFEKLVGLDISIQKYPYLRIARPKSKNDNIGFHRDTWYGSSPYEVSVLMPFTPMGIDNTLSLEPGSHGFPDERYEYEKVINGTIQKGSLKHQLGYPYMPGVLKDESVYNLMPISVQVGQALVFNLSVLHGQKLNNGDVTRFSTDCRLTNSLANQNISRSVHQDYYEVLRESPLHIQAKSHFLNNKVKE